MAKNTLYNKVWDRHKVATLPSGQDQLFIGLHLIHEVTTPQAFSQLAETNSKVLYPNRTFATMDHIIPTDTTQRPFQDNQAEKMADALEKNVENHKIKFFNTQSERQGIVHVIGPELGLTQPGMTIVCGDSHTSTHGAFGSLAFGIGTSEVKLTLQTQTLALNVLKVRRINVEGLLPKGVYAKDVILKIIQALGVKGGLGFCYEYGGTAIESMSMEERMTICNMSIEGGARIGYVNPDQTTYDYIKGREFAPKKIQFEHAKKYWKSIRSMDDAEYDDVVTFFAEELEPIVTWGINPEQSVGITQALPRIDSLDDVDQATYQQAYEFMDLSEGESILDYPIDVCFIGSCTNSRLSDLIEAAAVLKSKKVHPNVKCMIVPGSQQVKKAAEAKGLDRIFKDAGAEWKEPGCSMCLAMNPDKLNAGQRCASSSNRNFIGRQGSPTGKTLLMSPAMVAAAAIHGKVVDVREIL